MFNWLGSNNVGTKPSLAGLSLALWNRAICPAFIAAGMQYARLGRQFQKSIRFDEFSFLEHRLEVIGCCFVPGAGKVSPSDPKEALSRGRTLRGLTVPMDILHGPTLAQAGSARCVSRFKQEMEGKSMALYLSQEHWGRVCLHLVAALRAGHWGWHLTGIAREIECLRPQTCPQRLPRAVASSSNN